MASELIELKIESDTPYDAAFQILRYGAVYMLYRLEPERARRFKLHSMMRAKRIVLEAHITTTLAEMSIYAALRRNWTVRLRRSASVGRLGLHCHSVSWPLLQTSSTNRGWTAS